ncbi:MAG: NUDIX domain-containing protein [Candidatus Saccharibacteria bacterium]
MSNDELLDLVDKDDNVIGTIWRSTTNELENTKAGFIRAATALIQNDNGELWIPRRTADKRIAPNGLDSSMQEHVGSGESYLEATIRGFKEELNLDVTEYQLEYIGTVPPDNELYYFVALYVYKSNDAPEFNPEDFVGYEWIKPEELVSRLENGEPSKKSLLSTTKLLLQK